MAGKDQPGDKLDKAIDKSIDDFLNEPNVGKPGKEVKDKEKEKEKDSRKRDRPADPTRPAPSKHPKSDQKIADMREPEVGSLKLTKKQAVIVNYSARLIAGYTGLIMRNGGLDNKMMDPDIPFKLIESISQSSGSQGEASSNVEDDPEPAPEPTPGPSAGAAPKLELSDDNINKIAQIVAHKTRTRGNVSRPRVRASWSDAAPRGKPSWSEPTPRGRAGPSYTGERRARLPRRGGIRRPPRGRGVHTPSTTTYNDYGYEEPQFSYDQSYEEEGEYDENYVSY